MPTVKLAANFGAEEPFVARVWFTIPDLMEHMELDDIEEAKFKLYRIIDQLTFARNHLQHIEEEGFSKLPTTEQDCEYNDFYGAVWCAYKDRFQNFMREVGYDVGFMFVKPKSYENAASNFVAKHPKKKWLADFVRDSRKGWQNALNDYRNTGQHGGDRRAETFDIENTVTARNIFDTVWQNIEDIFVFLAEEKMQDGWIIRELAENQRDEDIPKRFIPWLRSMV